MKFSLINKKPIESQNIQIQLTKDNQCIIQSIPNKNLSNTKLLKAKTIEQCENDNNLNNLNHIPSDDLLNLSITQNDINNNQKNIKLNNTLNYTTNNNINEDNSENLLINLSELLDTTKSNETINIFPNNINGIYFNNKNNFILNNESNNKINKNINYINIDKITPLKYKNKQINNNKCEEKINNIFKKKVKKDENKFCRKKLFFNLNDTSDINTNNNYENENIDYFNISNNISNNNNNKIKNESKDKNNSNNNKNKKILNSKLNTIIKKGNEIINNNNSIINKKNEEKIIVNKTNSNKIKNNKSVTKLKKLNELNSEKFQKKMLKIKVNKNSNLNTNKIYINIKKNKQPITFNNKNIVIKKLKINNLPNYSLRYRSLNGSEISLSTVKTNNTNNSINTNKYNDSINIKDKKKNLNFKNIKIKKYSNENIGKIKHNLNKTNYSNYIDMSKTSKIYKKSEENTNIDIRINNSQEKNIKKENNKKLIKKIMLKNKKTNKKINYIGRNKSQIKSLEDINSKLNRYKSDNMDSYFRNKITSNDYSHIKNLTLKNNSIFRTLTDRNIRLKKNLIIKKTNKNECIKRSNTGNKKNDIKIDNTKNFNICTKRNNSHINKIYKNNIIKNKKNKQSLFELKNNKNKIKDIHSNILENKLQKLKNMNISNFQNSNIGYSNSSYINNNSSNNSLINKNNISIINKENKNSRNITKSISLNNYTYKSFNDLNKFIYLKYPKEIIKNFSNYIKKIK